ncbi:hypothetical protein B0T09DRAFT_363013 [Sordaria sp. MPI-SDFR-AT-0083]|nr:hypothetical protein B0T09DRAFT_363013 [Sordaria sp. MPI-SDFR-AT-0083]
MKAVGTLNKAAELGESHVIQAPPRGYEKVAEAVYNVYPKKPADTMPSKTKPFVGRRYTDLNTRCNWVRESQHSFYVSSLGVITTPSHLNTSNSI